jgi:hypothetical protein
MMKEVLMSESFNSPKSFSPKMVSTMRAVLDLAVNRISPLHRTPATKAKMAEQILLAASDNMTDPDLLIAVAIEAGRQPAA